VTAFFLIGFEFSAAQKNELIHRGLPGNVVADLQSELDVIKSFDTTEPATRREMKEQMKVLADAFEAAENAIDSINHWTVSNLEPRAYGIHDFSRGRPKTNILLRELTHALKAYRHAARQAKVDLEASGPERGSDPEYAMRIAFVTKTVLERNGVALDGAEKGLLTLAITMAFKALGITKGEPKAFAAKALAAPKIVLSKSGGN
jgi:hypothetical protein